MTIASPTLQDFDPNWRKPCAPKPCARKTTPN